MSAGGLAVVTGGAGALGMCIAGRLAEAGHDLLLVDRDPSVSQAAERLQSGSASRPAVCVADLTQDDGVERVVAAIRTASRSCAVLVNCAGITRDARVRDMTESAFASVIDVNLVASARLTLALKDSMIEGASVVNMSSRASLGNFGQANYVASKSGLIGLTRALANSWAPRVRVNAVAPSLIDSPMTQAMPSAVLAKLVARIPAGRIGTPDDVSEVVAFLASPSASYITGQVLVVCGGRSIAAS